MGQPSCLVQTRRKARCFGSGLALREALIIFIRKCWCAATDHYHYPLCAVVPMHFFDFASEILCQIYSLLLPQDLRAIACVSRTSKDYAYYAASSKYQTMFGNRMSRPLEFARTYDEAKKQGFPPRKNVNATELAIWACQNDHSRLMDHLMREHIPFDEVTALRVSLMCGSMDCSKSLLSRIPKAILNEPIHPACGSPLVVPLAQDNVNTLQLLVDCATDPDIDGLLLLAARFGSENVTHWLLEKGANPNVCKVRVANQQLSLITPVR